MSCSGMEKTLNFIPVFQEGGIGDLIVALPLIKSMFKESTLPIKFYSQFPEIARYFLPWIEIAGDIPKAYRDRSSFDYYISISDMARFFCTSIKSMPPFLLDIYNVWQQHSAEWQPYITAHPFKANDMAKKAVGMGLNRYTLAFQMLNKKPIDFPFSLNQTVKAPKLFLTIHDGFDASGFYKFERSTKSWSVKAWEELITLLKQQYKELYIVQLGGVKHRKIKGVDINLAGQLTFEQSLVYLNSSLLHIDGDSGLVHARHLLNKPSIVLFGPTNVDYFGYKANTNMAPKVCGDCWWKNKDWMEKCMEGYETPKCIDSILPVDVFEKVKQLLFLPLELPS